MSKKFISILLSLMATIPVWTQNRIQEISREIVSNNLNIKALSLENRLKVLENKEKMVPEDPEISYGYLWGSPSLIGNRTDVNGSQRFKFPTYYWTQRKANQLSNDLFDKELEMRSNEVVYELMDRLIQLVSLSQKKSQINERLSHLKRIYQLAGERLKAGETNRVEVDKAKLMVDGYEQDLLQIETDERVIRHELTRLNGGVPLASVDIKYLDFGFLKKFNQTGNGLFGNSLIELAELNSEVEEANKKVARSGVLPDLLVGYTSEAINGEKLAGIEMGISIPLWGKTNMIRRAHLKKEIADERLAIAEQMVTTDWETYGAMANQYLQIKNNLEQSLQSYKTIDILEQSWKMGEISLLDYLKELPFLYDVENRILESEKQYYRSLLLKARNNLQTLVNE